MLNLISVELFKMRKNKVFYFATLGMILWNLFIFWVNYESFIQDRVPMNAMLLAFNMIMCFLSGTVITLLFHREYQDNVIINLLTAPTDRTKFVLSKIVAWAVWHFLTHLITLIMITFYFYFISGWDMTVISQHVLDLSRLCLFSFISLLPLVWIAVFQKKVFFASIIGTFLLTMAIFMVGGEEWHWFIIPWTAVAPVSIGDFQEIVGTTNIMVGTTSILLTGVISIIGACWTFNRQDQ